MVTGAALRPRLLSARVWLPVLRAAALAAAVYGGLVFVVAPLTGHFSGEFEDFRAYLGAAQASAAHADIYAAFTQQAQNVALSGFDYPPLVALLVTPLAWTSPQVAATAWLLVGVAATLAGTLIVARTLLPATWPRVELAVLATFTFAPATYNLWHGQMNPVVFLLLAAALHCWVRGRQTWCGTLIGIAAAIKLAPAVLLLLFIRRRWWRGLAAGAAVLVFSAAGGALAFGLHTTLEYVRAVLPVLGRDDGWLYNQSWAGAVNRAFAHSVLTYDPPLLAARVIAWSLSGAGVVAAAWAVQRQAHNPEQRGAEFGAGILAMLLAGTITWYAHDIHLLIPLAAGAALATRLPACRRTLAVALIAAGAATAILAPLLIGAASMPAIVAASHTAFWWPLLQVVSLPTFSAAGLLAAVILALRSARFRQRSEVVTSQYGLHKSGTAAQGSPAWAEAATTAGSRGRPDRGAQPAGAPGAAGARPPAGAGHSY